MNRYIKVSIDCSEEIQELLIAELGQLDYDSFQQHKVHLDAFIDVDLINETALIDVLKKYHLQDNYSSYVLKNTNWNEEWEKNFDPVYIEDQVQIRASFHRKKEAFKHDIIINPKMAFGTGHHETTSLMIAEQLRIDHKNKRVLDVGAGTGILSIMAYKLGAKSIVSTDIDNWSIENCNENFELNKLRNFQILHGKIENLTLDGDFDIVIANINKNVLLQELPSYTDLLRIDGKLILSGFYAHDIKELKEMALIHGLSYQSSEQKNDWAMLCFSKPKV